MNVWQVLNVVLYVHLFVKSSRHYLEVNITISYLRLEFESDHLSLLFLPLTTSKWFCYYCSHFLYVFLCYSCKRFSVCTMYVGLEIVDCYSFSAKGKQTKTNNKSWLSVEIQVMIRSSRGSYNDSLNIFSVLGHIEREICLNFFF